MTNTASQPANPSLRLRFDEHGLIPVVAQDATTREVLLLAYMNELALDATLATGDLTLWSRSRQELWRKGDTSGHRLRVVELRVNCENNSLLAQVELTGPGACHEGYRGCYYRTLSGEKAGAVSAQVVERRAFDPANVYSTEREQDAALERDARILYAAYERLRDGPAPASSKTAALLHASDSAEVSARALGRARQELEELRGVLAGTHRHHGDARDVVLEASQVGYWTMLAAVAQRLPYDAWRPERAWLAGWRQQRIDHQPEHELARMLSDIVLDAGALCRAASIHPAGVVAADLEEMRSAYGDI